MEEPFHQSVSQMLHIDGCISIFLCHLPVTWTQQVVFDVLYEHDKVQGKH